MRTFDTWEEAFSYCRSQDKTVVVAVKEGEQIHRFKLFPSGQAKCYPSGLEVIDAKK